MYRMHVALAQYARRHEHQRRDHVRVRCGPIYQEAVAAQAAADVDFFSSRRRHRRYWRDWSSDVCSSDLALPALAAGLLLSVLLGYVAGDWEATGPVDGFGWLLLVVLLTTPLQSAAEEYVFRGYLSQAIAAWVGRPRAGAVVAAVLTAALFSAAHLPPDVWTFLDRFAFGLAASAVVWLTGGLEAAIVLHAVNNVVVFLLAGSLGEGVATDAVPAGTGVLVVLIDLLAMAAYVGLVVRTRRWLRPEVRTAALDLRPPSPRGVPGPPAGIGYGVVQRREVQHDPWGMG